MSRQRGGAGGGEVAEVRWRRRGVCWRCVRGRGFECFGAAQQAANHSLASASGARGGGSLAVSVHSLARTGELELRAFTSLAQVGSIRRHVKKHLLTCCLSLLHHAPPAWPPSEHHWHPRPSPCIHDNFNAFLRSLPASAMHLPPLRQNLDS